MFYSLLDEDGLWLSDDVVFGDVDGDGEREGDGQGQQTDLRLQEFGQKDAFCQLSHDASLAALDRWGEAGSDQEDGQQTGEQFHDVRGEEVAFR